MKSIVTIRKLVPLVILVVLAVVMRFYQLGQVPVCLSNDEAAFGYNAYSLLKTGNDEYGVKLPLIFKSVGDAKLPLTIYLLTVPIRVFGLTEWSIRLPSALFGVAGVLLVYQITLEIFRRKRVALSAGLVMAISPWGLTHSRALFDTNLSFTFVLLGTFLFLRWTRLKRGIIIASVLSFVAAIYTYYSDRLFVPLFVLGLLLIYRKEVLKQKKDLVVALIVGFVAFSPLLYNLAFSKVSYTKILITTIFTYNRPEKEQARLRKEDGPVLYTIFHTKVLEDGMMIARRYFNHFSSSFLFVSGTKDDLKQMIYGMGEMYLVDAIFLTIGIVALLQRREVSAKKLILLWLLIGPLPAAITRDEVHGRRAMEMLTPLTIISGLGLVTLIDYLKSRKGLKSVVLGFLVALISIFCVGYYLLSYYVFSPARSLKGPGGWSCGYKELVQKTTAIESAFNKIIIDTSYQSPYLFFLFYQHYPPERYQLQARLVFEEGHNLGESPGYDKYEFRPINWLNDRGLRDTLLAIPPEKIKVDEINDGSRIIGTVDFPGGSPAFYLVSTGK